jgi:tetratricopeptide (TPR) repeat protein
MSAEFAPQGSLEATDFVVLVRRAHEQKLSGSLTLTQGKAKKVIRFDQGEICAAASNLAQDSVLGLLVTGEHLTPADADEIRSQIAAGKPMGELLSQSGKVPREVLVGLRQEQIIFILSSLYEWRKGEYKLEDNLSADEKKPAPLNITTPGLILQAARRFQDADKLSRLLRNVSAPRQMMSEAFTKCAQWHLQPEEGYLLTRLDAPMTITDLTMISGLPESETLRALYVLECAGLVAVQEQESAPIRQNKKTADAKNNVPLHAVSQKAAAQNNSGSLSVPVTQNPTEPEFTLAEQLEDIRRTFERINACTEHHEVLGVSKNATKSQVKQAFARLTKKYHPDRYHNQADSETVSQLSEMFLRIRKAYDVLKELAVDGPDPAPEPAFAPQATPVIERPESRSPQPEYTKVNAVPQIEQNDFVPASPGYATSSVFDKSEPDSIPPATQESVSPVSETSPEENPSLQTESVIAGNSVGEGASLPTIEETSEEADLPLPEMFFRHALARYQSGDLIAAIELMQRAVKLQPNNALFQDQLATLLAYNPRRRKEAEVHLLKAIDLEPQNAIWHYHLALLYKTVGFTTRAEDKLKEAAALDPTNQTYTKELQAMQKQNRKSVAEAKKKETEKKEEAEKISLNAPVSEVFSKLFKRK